jgi:sirohydrochlorin cobaltochelatase
VTALPDQSLLKRIKTAIVRLFNRRLRDGDGARSTPKKTEYGKSKMAIDSKALAEFGRLDARIKTILPENYQDSYEDVQPTSMGSAGLKYGGDGKVAWNEMWGTFCDLAMAGGPPHKGTLLEHGLPAEIEAQPESYQQVVDEICRGVTLASNLPCTPSGMGGWVCVKCHDKCMAEWLVRAIVMENVEAYCEGRVLHLPAGPNYRIEKEIKNVVTVIAKSSHYWVEHMWLKQQRAMTEMFATMAEEFPVIQSAFAPSQEDEEVCERMATEIQELTGLQRAGLRYPGWLGMDCPSVRCAISMTRALVASNVLSRREGTVLFVPVNRASDSEGKKVVGLVSQIHRYVMARGIV